MPQPKEQTAPKGGALCRPLLWAALPVLALAVVMFFRYPLWDTGWPQDGTAAYFAPGLAAAAAGEGRIELNSADFYALCALPGIGAVKAQAILEAREARGGFSSPEQLLEVPGIGEKTLAGLLDWVYVSGDPPA